MVNIKLVLLQKDVGEGRRRPMDVQAWRQGGGARAWEGRRRRWSLEVRGPRRRPS